jgi:hypothetical protein
VKAHADTRADRKGVIYAVRDRGLARLPWPAGSAGRQVPVALPQHPCRQSSGEFRLGSFPVGARTSGLTSEYLQKGTEVTGDIDYLCAAADSRIQEAKRSVHEAHAGEPEIPLVAV